MGECPSCGIETTESGFHCGINGNDHDFCSEECIKKYSNKHPHAIITIYEAEKKMSEDFKNSLPFKVRLEIGESLLEDNPDKAKEVVEWVIGE